MYRIKPKHRIIAVFLTLNFLTTLLPVNLLYSNTNGPKAPEAASFEPVDATDMVNLVTGDFSYVLPLLNVPSPEGGYPLALAYHAGIAMDQEASWVGLGWNLNPGAINRNVNGYPDDYNASLLTEYFYDEGGTKSVYSLSIGYGAGMASAGLNFSWGSDRALGGAINIGYGVGSEETGRLGGSLSIGTEGVGIGLGATTKGGLSLGLNANSNGNIGGSIGFDNNGTGFNVGYSSQGGASVGVSAIGEKGNFMDVNLSASGIGFLFGTKGENAKKNATVSTRAGIGLSLAFNNSVTMGDYTMKSSGWMIPVFVPIGPGFLSLSAGKRKYRYFLGEKKYSNVFGPLNFNGQLRNSNHFDNPCTRRGCPGAELVQEEAFMDFYEFGVESNDIEDEIEIAKNNLAFPSYDNYHVHAQGISGTMKSTLWENGALFGLSNDENEENSIVNYAFDGDYNNRPDYVTFVGTPYFQFDNEINTYLRVLPGQFNSVDTNVDSPEELYNPVSQINPHDLGRRTTSNHVTYYTNSQISEYYKNGTALPNGYLGPNLQDLDRDNLPDDGIGAFRITVPDGKTYHYSIPVYNHEIVTRSFGMVKNGNNPKTGK